VDPGGNFNDYVFASFSGGDAWVEGIANDNSTAETYTVYAICAPG